MNHQQRERKANSIRSIGKGSIRHDEKALFYCIENCLLISNHWDMKLTLMIHAWQIKLSMENK